MIKVYSIIQVKLEGEENPHEFGDELEVKDLLAGMDISYNRYTVVIGDEVVIFPINPSFKKEGVVYTKDLKLGKYFIDLSQLEDVTIESRLLTISKEKGDK